MKSKSQERTYFVIRYDYVLSAIVGPGRIGRLEMEDEVGGE